MATVNIQSTKDRNYKFFYVGDTVLVSGTAKVVKSIAAQDTDTAGNDYASHVVTLTDSSTSLAREVTLSYARKS